MVAMYLLYPYPHSHPYKTHDALTQPGIDSVSSLPWRLQPSDSVGRVTDGRRSSSGRFHFHRSSRSCHRVNSVICPACGSFVAQKGFPRYVRKSWNGSLDSEESRPGSIWEKTEPPTADSRPRARSHSVVGRHRGWLWTSLSHVNSGRSEQLESACSLGIESDGAKLYTISAGTWASADGAQGPSTGFRSSGLVVGPGQTLLDTTGFRSVFPSFSEPLLPFLL
ncbi:hypothetical protein BHM03_00028568 [Ensete ventricosum]|uniref:Uncharacterized protein n=1 Tax=Ensete ventricosum TaxID=4639 RepID=A0A445MI27_ENSVE|nr:hypothetical protein BHM03_00028568 [Ensete ventricosum]